MQCRTDAVRMFVRKKQIYGQTKRDDWEWEIMAVDRSFNGLTSQTICMSKDKKAKSITITQIFVQKQYSGKEKLTDEQIEVVVPVNNTEVNQSNWQRVAWCGNHFF